MCICARLFCDFVAIHRQIALSLDGELILSVCCDPIDVQFNSRSTYIFFLLFASFWILCGTSLVHFVCSVDSMIRVVHKNIYSKCGQVSSKAKSTLYTSIVFIHFLFVFFLLQLIKSRSKHIQCSIQTYESTFVGVPLCLTRIISIFRSSIFGTSVWPRHFSFFFSLLFSSFRTIRYDGRWCGPTSTCHVTTINLICCN